jgi:hypothetical protein
MTDPSTLHSTKGLNHHAAFLDLQHLTTHFAFLKLTPNYIPRLVLAAPLPLVQRHLRCRRQYQRPTLARAQGSRLNIKQQFRTSGTAFELVERSPPFTVSDTYISD